MMEDQIPFSVDAEIIDINLEPTFRDHVGENAVHKRLKGGGTVAKSEEHYGRFEKAKRHDKCALLLIFFLDSNIVVSPPHVKLGEQGGILHVVNEFGDKG
jgi:hypothetical protein